MRTKLYYSCLVLCLLGCVQSWAGLGPQTVNNGGTCCVYVRWINTPCGDIYPDGVCPSGGIGVGHSGGPYNIPCSFNSSTRFQILNQCTGGVIYSTHQDGSDNDPGQNGTNGATHNLNPSGGDTLGPPTIYPANTAIYNPTLLPQTYIGTDASGNPTGDWVTIMPGRTGTLSCSTCTGVVGVGQGNGISGSGGTITSYPWGIGGTGSQIYGYPPVTNPLPGPPEGPGNPPIQFPDPFPVNPPGNPINNPPVDPFPIAPPYTNPPATSGTNGIIWGSSTNSNTINQQGFGAVYSAVTEDTKDVVGAIQKFNQDNNRSIMNATNMLGQSFSSFVAQGVGISNGVTRIDGSLLIVTNLLGQIYARQAFVGNGISNTVWQLQPVASNSFIVLQEIRDTNALEFITLTNILQALTNQPGTNFDFTGAVNAGRAMGESQVADLYTPAAQLNSMTVMTLGAPGALMIPIGQLSVNFNPLSTVQWSNFAAWSRKTFTWIWTFLYVAGAWKITQEHMRSSVSARQTTFNFGAPGLNQGFATTAAVVISTALGSIPALFVFFFSDAFSSLASHPWSGAGGSILDGLAYLDIYCAAPIAFSNAAFLLAYQMTVGRVFWVSTTIVRYCVG